MVFLFASEFISIRKLLFGGLEPGSNINFEQDRAGLEPALPLS